MESIPWVRCASGNVYFMTQRWNISFSTETILIYISQKDEISAKSHKREIFVIQSGAAAVVMSEMQFIISEKIP